MPCRVVVVDATAALANTRNLHNANNTCALEVVWLFFAILGDGVIADSNAIMSEWQSKRTAQRTDHETVVVGITFQWSAPKRRTIV